MLGLPPAVTAATGMDALSHAIECYTCDYHQPFNDAVALQAIELVGRWLRRRRRGRLQPRGAHAHGARGDARRDGVRDRERRRGARDEPVGRRRPRLSARRAHRTRPRAGDGVQRAGRSRALRANRAGARRRHQRTDVRSRPRYAGVEELYRLTDDVGIPTMAELGFSEDEIPMLARIAFEDPQTIGNAARGRRRRL